MVMAGQIRKLENVVTALSSAREILFSFSRMTWVADGAVLSYKVCSELAREGNLAFVAKLRNDSGQVYSEKWEWRG